MSQLGRNIAIAITWVAIGFAHSIADNEEGFVKPIIASGVICNFSHAIHLSASYSLYIFNKVL